MKTNIADKICLIIMILLPITALLYLYYILETYTQTVHNECGFFVSAYAVACLIALMILFLKSRKKGIRYAVVAALSLLVLLFVLCIAEKIPFCVQCDQVTAEELGFLTYWIPPCDA